MDLVDPHIRESNSLGPGPIAVSVTGSDVWLGERNATPVWLARIDPIRLTSLSFSVNASMGSSSGVATDHRKVPIRQFEARRPGEQLEDRLRLAHILGRFAQAGR